MKNNTQNAREYLQSLRIAQDIRIARLHTDNLTQKHLGPDFEAKLMTQDQLDRKLTAHQTEAQQQQSSLNQRLKTTKFFGGDANLDKANTTESEAWHAWRSTITNGMYQLKIEGNAEGIFEQTPTDDDRTAFSNTWGITRTNKSDITFAQDTTDYFASTKKADESRVMPRNIKNPATGPEAMDFSYRSGQALIIQHLKSNAPFAEHIWLGNRTGDSNTVSQHPCFFLPPFTRDSKPATMLYRGALETAILTQTHIQFEKDDPVFRDPELEALRRINNIQKRALSIAHPVPTLSEDSASQETHEHLKRITEHQSHVDIQTWLFLKQLATDTSTAFSWSHWLDREDRRIPLIISFALTAFSLLLACLVFYISPSTLLLLDPWHVINIAVAPTTILYTLMAVAILCIGACFAVVLMSDPNKIWGLKQCKRYEDTFVKILKSNPGKRFPAIDYLLNSQHDLLGYIDYNQLGITNLSLTLRHEMLAELVNLESEAAHIDLNLDNPHSPEPRYSQWTLINLFRRAWEPYNFERTQVEHPDENGFAGMMRGMLDMPSTLNYRKNFEEQGHFGLGKHPEKDALRLKQSLERNIVTTQPLSGSVVDTQNYQTRIHLWLYMLSSLNHHRNTPAVIAAFRTLLDRRQPAASESKASLPTTCPLLSAPTEPTLTALFNHIGQRGSLSLPSGSGSGVRAPLLSGEARVGVGAPLAAERPWAAGYTEAQHSVSSTLRA